MIFVTVGGHLPFDRLVATVDWWAREKGRADVFAQIGQTLLRPRHIGYVQFLPPAELRCRMEQAEYIVGHAGTGTILTALELAKPLLVVPRRAEYRESVNDHQVATAKHFAAQSKVVLALTEGEFPERFEALKAFQVATGIGLHAPEPLLARIRAFAFDEP